MVPHIPPELIAHIIKLSLPPLSFKNFRERYATLLPFHLVNKEWCGLARHELWKHMRIGSLLTQDIFLEGNYVPTLLPPQVSLWLGGWDDSFDVCPTELQEYNPVLGACPREGCIAISNVDVRMNSLRYLQRAKTLLLLDYFCIINDTDKSFDQVTLNHLNLRFEHLTSLTLHDPLHLWADQLNPTCFPQLSYLTIKTIEQFRETGRVVQALPVLASQLKSFIFVECWQTWRPPLHLSWSKMDSLQHLHLGLLPPTFKQSAPALADLSSTNLKWLSIGKTRGDDYSDSMTFTEAFETIKGVLDATPHLVASLKTVAFFEWSQDEYESVSEIVEEGALRYKTSTRACRRSSKKEPYATRRKRSNLSLYTKSRMSSIWDSCSA